MSESTKLEPLTSLHTSGRRELYLNLYPGIVTIGPISGDRKSLSPCGILQPATIKIPKATVKFAPIRLDVNRTRSGFSISAAVLEDSVSQNLVLSASNIHT